MLCSVLPAELQQHTLPGKVPARAYSHGERGGREGEVGERRQCPTIPLGRDREDRGNVNVSPALPACLSQGLSHDNTMSRTQTTPPHRHRKGRVAGREGKGTTVSPTPATPWTTFHESNRPFVPSQNAQN